MTYVGRFAPSPTGPLHAGSLLAAVASYLHARRAGGEWLLRIDDIDPPRESPGAPAAIQSVLESLDLYWDRPVLFQSARTSLYEAVAERLLADGKAFLCSCSRSELRARAEQTGTSHGGDESLESRAYSGTCRNRRSHTGPTAIRMRVDGHGLKSMPADALQGPIPPTALDAQGDYVIRRRDGLPAYHLATVIDDALQGVTTIVRGIDLLEAAAVQHHLQHALRLPTPAYFHIPVLVDPSGCKLSKQTGAAAIDLTTPSRTAAAILTHLGASPPPELQGAPPRELWHWATETWQIERLAGITKIAHGKD
ncbi:MAG TPA: tRNA glutamyl-Q(34) synthetase GluQRS [Gammaproteobacteria bacterium]|nr:tRNA glutamyl-Q(34) synthetase GluQRS [Gammaproteobacteria bacterium]